MASIEISIDTPCIRVRALHPTLLLCVGGGRSLDQIARWMPRLKAMAGADSAPATA